jgi:putative component of membrane protein insertase Oxa1/YidC/SpoIIIJ protein YidD
MMLKKTYVVRYFNEPELNKLLAPQNKLYRPVLDIKRTLLKIIFCLLVSFIFAIIISKSFFYISLFLLFLVFSKESSVGSIHLYQRYASAEMRLKCCMFPSCSQYTAMAIKRYGAVIGIWKGFFRIIKRCKPPGGRDLP